MATTKNHSPAYLWVSLSPMEKAIWASAYAGAKGTAVQRARAGDLAIRSLQTLEESREAEFGPEYEAARSTIRLDFEEFAAWYRVQQRVAKGPVDKVPSDDDCSKAYERYEMGLFDFY